MKISHIFYAGIAGTTAFTLFSYIASKQKRANYKEPELLGHMIDESVAEAKTETAQKTGWVLHYLTGCAFTTCYAFFITKAHVKPSPVNGLIAGALSGIVAITWWDAALSLHPRPPRKPSADYMVQLFIGHVIFGVVSFYIFRRCDTGKNSTIKLAGFTGNISALPTKIS